MKVAFILGEFPELYGRFILDQIIGLLDNGIDVKIFSLIKVDREYYPKEIDNYKLFDRTTYLSIPRNKVERVWLGLNYLIGSFYKHPIKIAGTLNIFKHGKIAGSLYPFFLYNCFINLEEEFDIIHCHFGQRGIYGAILKNVGIKGKLITSFYGGDLTAFVNQSKNGIYNYLFKQGDLFLPLSENFKQKLLDLNCPKDKIKVHFVSINTKKMDIELKPSKQIIILTVARLIEKKGHKYLIEAMPNIIKKHPNIKFIFIGEM